jgi:putative flavoprotein involved in K+ transport
MQEANGTQITVANDLMDNIARADNFAAEFKKGVNKYVEKTGMDVPSSDEKGADLQTAYDSEIITQLDLDAENITTVIWATGYDFDYSWIKFPVFDDMGYPETQQGVTEQPGLYFVGLHFLHTRESGLLSGVGEDAAHIARHIANVPEHQGEQ